MERIVIYHHTTNTETKKISKNSKNSVVLAMAQGLDLIWTVNGDLLSSPDSPVKSTRNLLTNNFRT